MGVSHVLGIYFKQRNEATRWWYDSVGVGKTSNFPVLLPVLPSLWSFLSCTVKMPHLLRSVQTLTQTEPPSQKRTVQSKRSFMCLLVLFESPLPWNTDKGSLAFQQAGNWVIDNTKRSSWACDGWNHRESCLDEYGNVDVSLVFRFLCRKVSLWVHSFPDLYGWLSRPVPWRVQTLLLLCNRLHIVCSELESWLTGLQH